MAKISIVKTNNGIKNALIKAIDLIGGIGEFVGHGDTVMLKPNINGTEGITNIELVESLIQLLNDFGVKKITIAEAAFGPANMTDMFFEKTGYVELCKKYNIDLINLNKSEIKLTYVEKPLLMNSLNIAKEVFEFDKIINIPIMKVHYATGITLALKNMKGVLVGEEKRHFHETGLDKSIVDLNNTIKPDLNIIDCISCMEKMGPRGGDIVDLNFIMAGVYSGEIDYIGSKIMGYSIDEVKHLKYFIEHNNTKINNIEVVGETIDDVKYNFKKVFLPDILPKNFDIQNVNACSSCMNALLLSFSFLDKEVSKDIDVYLGSKTETNKSSAKYSLAFGNCACLSENDFDEKVRGCPPYPFDLGKVLKKI